LLTWTLHAYSSLILHLPTSPLFPYTTLFRSLLQRHGGRGPRLLRELPLHGRGFRPLPVASDRARHPQHDAAGAPAAAGDAARAQDRKSTRLNSSHVSISYAVFCLKKKNVSSDNANSSSPVVSRTVTSAGTAASTTTQSYSISPSTPAHSLSLVLTATAAQHATSAP